MNELFHLLWSTEMKHFMLHVERKQYTATFIFDIFFWSYLTANHNFFFIRGMSCFLTLFFFLQTKHHFKKCIAPQKIALLAGDFSPQ